MAAANTDKLMEVGNPGSATTLSSPGYTIGGSSINVGSTTNWPTTTGVCFAIDEVETVDGEQVRVSGTYNEYYGTVNTATQITNVTHVSGSGTDRNYSAGSSTRVYIPVASGRENRIVEWGTAEHNQDGTHSDITATSITTDSLTITGAADSEGWSATGSTLTYVSNDGNKQATYKFTGEDKTGTLQEGMKIKLPRPTAVGTQCADLEASSSQYASKSSPTGITFTDDFTCGAWVKAESFPNASNYIISRITGGSGFVFNVQQNGTVRILGGSSSNLDYGISYQSVPTGEWVHITASLNMSGAVAEIYINGVLVADSYTNGSASAITQAGDLAIGSDSGGSYYFDGKIKHAFVADKVLSEAEVKEAMVSDDLTTASFSSNLDAYFKLEGDFTDSSANGNDLTASGGAVATDADSPFSSTEYGIITSASFSTDTTLTVFFGNASNPVNENVTAPAYSTHSTPYGFPSKSSFGVGSTDKHNIATSESSTSTSSTDLATYGPHCTIFVGPSGKALVGFKSVMKNSGVAFTVARVSVDNTSLSNAGFYISSVNTNESTGSYTGVVDGLSPGWHTFVMKYSVSSGTGTWQQRQISAQYIDDGLIT